MKTLWTAAIAVAFLLTGSAWASDHPEHPKAHEKGTLDGKVFVGTMGKAGETEGDKDQLTFTKGTFMSSACVPFGFHEAPYTVTEKDGVMTFASSPKNAEGDTMSWTGTIKDGILEGTAVNKTAAGETKFWFKGKLGAADAAKSPEHPKSEHPEHPK